jgi:predicted methyltransferase
MAKTPILYCDDGSETELPFKWVICSRCDGHNRSTAHVEADGGGITASEMAELGDDFREDYMSGVYDRPCPHCEGGKVKIADTSQMTKAQRREYRAQMQADREIDAIHAAERRMGA